MNVAVCLLIHIMDFSLFYFIFVVFDSVSETSVKSLYVNSVHVIIVWIRLHVINCKKKNCAPGFHVDVAAQFLST